MPNVTALPGLLIALALALVCAFAVLTLISWMMENLLDVGPGLGGIAILLIVMLVTIFSKSHFVAGAVIVVLLNLIVFLPYAIEQAAKAEMQGTDIDKLDRVHKEISERPENIASYFAISELVYDLGLPGHAVAIAERTLSRLSTETDPIKNQSIRDIFKAEESRAREWRRNIKDQKEFRPVACPRCGHRNEPGNIACGKCQGPFLLDLARGIDPRQKIRSRLVLGWAFIAGFFTLTVYGWSEFAGAARWVIVVGGLMTIAGVFTWLFRRRKLGRR